MKTVITYGTFDLLHYGHIEILRRAKELVGENGRLIVAVSTDEFNAIKGKKAHMPFERRKELVSAIRYVDDIIPENDWEQKVKDVAKYNVDIFVIGDDWKGKFDHLKKQCKVVYLERTPTVSSTLLRSVISELKQIEHEAE